MQDVKDPNIFYLKLHLIQLYGATYLVEFFLNLFLYGVTLGHLSIFLGVSYFEYWPRVYNGNWGVVGKVIVVWNLTGLGWTYSELLSTGSALGNAGNLLSLPLILFSITGLREPYLRVFLYFNSLIESKSCSSRLDDLFFEELGDLLFDFWLICFFED